MATSRARTRRRPIVCVVSRFNEPITRRLLDGALEVLRRRGVVRSSIRILWVPGAFELPYAAARAVTRLQPRGIVALGCVLRGRTPQYAVIGQAVANGLMQVAVTSRVPVGFGVIIADSYAQARARVNGSVGHRGREAAEAVMEAIALHRQRGST